MYHWMIKLLNFIIHILKNNDNTDNMGGYLNFVKKVYVNLWVLIKKIDFDFITIYKIKKKVMSTNNYVCECCQYKFNKLYQLMKHCRVVHSAEFIQTKNVENLINSLLNNKGQKKSASHKKLKALNNLVSSPFY